MGSKKDNFKMKSNKSIKDQLVIKEGDVVKIDSTAEAYGQKSYVVLSVQDTTLRCRLEVKNPFDHTECTYFKDELSDEMIEKFSFRNN